MAVNFISEQTLKDRTGMSNAVDGKQLAPMIKVSQDIFIMPALGSTLYQRLQQGVSDDNLNANEITLINDYLTDALVWATMGYLAVPMGYQLFSKGFLQKNADNSNAPTKNEIDSISEHYENLAEHYKQRMINYLRANYTLFEEYAEPGCGWDVVQPALMGYDCPIYIGDSGDSDCVGSSSSSVVASHPAVYTYTATGGEVTFEASILSGKSVLLAIRAGVVRSIVTVSTSDTNELQIVDATVTLPTGDAATAGEVFKFLYV